MNKKTKRILILVACIALCLCGVLCGKWCGGPAFHIEGTITNAADSVLYLENIGLNGIVGIDSVTLSDKGHFSLKGKKPETPEFYRLRIANQTINLSVDSTETITITASYPTMATAYEVSGSEECATIKELTLKLIDLQRQAIAIQRDRTLSYAASADSIMSIVQSYKQDITRNYIYSDPRRPSAYFALFQTLGGVPIFNPQEYEDDVKVFGAVATSWDTYYPNALRGQNLHNIAIEGMKNIRILRANRMERSIEAEKINMANIIDIQLLDNKGNLQRLTDLKGKVVLLDFHAFATQDSPQRIMQMRELYNRYHARGFEIFQVALDTDEHFWKTQTAALPWICVLDPSSVSSAYLAAYNVQQVPTFFLVGRDNALHKRDAQISDLNAEIEQLLK